MGFQGAILAAGHGERLRASGGATVPKPLVEVGGVPLLIRQAAMMLAMGAEEVIAVVNSETASLISEIARPSKLSFVVRDTASSMESLFTLGERLEHGHFLLATVDAILREPEFRSFVANAQQMTSSGSRDYFDGAIAVTRWRGDNNPLFTNMARTGLITAFGAGESPMVTAGVYWLPTAVFQFAARAREGGLSALRAFLQLIVVEKIRLAAVEVTEAIDIDEAADLEAARRMIAGNP